MTDKFLEPTLHTKGPVLIIGTGLLGASIGLALYGRGVPVFLRDVSGAAMALARDVGAGEFENGSEPSLVIVATPPDLAGDVASAALAEFPGAIVTDVASVKDVVLQEVTKNSPSQLDRYIGSHPMAGRERSGPAAADSDLFIGRPWVICPHDETSPEVLTLIQDLAVDLGASPITMGTEEHDHAVALVSHLPQMMASLVAAQLEHADPHALSLAGQGLRDVTRIAASDPLLWASILVGNAQAMRTVVAGVREQFDSLYEALTVAETMGPLSPGAMSGLARVISAGNNGVARIPGKHGGARRRYREVTVLVPDQPGELGRLFGEIGDVGVNIEDFHMEHSPRQKVGMAYISVRPERADELAQALEARGWRVVLDQ